MKKITFFPLLLLLFSNCSDSDEVPLNATCVISGYLVKYQKYEIHTKFSYGKDNTPLSAVQTTKLEANEKPHETVNITYSYENGRMRRIEHDFVESPSQDFSISISYSPEMISVSHPNKTYFYLFNSNGQIIEHQYASGSPHNTRNRLSRLEYETATSKNPSRILLENPSTEQEYDGGIVETVLDNKKSLDAHYLALHGHPSPYSNNIMKEVFKGLDSNGNPSERIVNYSYNYNPQGYVTGKNCIMPNSSDSYEVFVTYTCN